MFRKTFFVLLIELCIFALTPQAFAAIPNSGTEIQQIPRLPVQPKTAPEISVQEENKSSSKSAADGNTIIVKALHINGQTLYSEAELLTVTGFKPGSELSLSALRAMTAKIANFYHKQGYFVAQAYLPAQDIKEGVVKIAVVEGQYGNITVNNASTLSSRLTHSLLEGLNNKAAIAIPPLEQRLLLLSDIPGVNIKSTLIPGASVGSSDLIVDVMPGSRVTGSIDADNGGGRYTGSNRLGITENINEPFGQGDVATVRALISADRMNYARAAYQAQIEKAKLGAAYTTMSYRLGQEFESLDANGRADIRSLYGSYPFIRSRLSNLNYQFNYDNKDFRDTVHSASTVTDKKVQVWMNSLTGNYQSASGNAAGSYALTWTAGLIDIISPDALAADASTVHTNGHYDKLGFNVSHLQTITDATSFYMALNGQMASKNLDISEKIGLGGPNAVRAYPSGETYGDRGYVLNLEARRWLPKFSEKMPGQAQLVGFIDTGSVTLNKNPATIDQNRKVLSGAGIGFNWVDNNNFVVKVSCAHKLSSAAATSAPDASNRFWVQAVKYF